MAPQLNEEEVLKALSGLSPRGKHQALRRLISDLAELDRVVDQNQEKLLAFCRERGIDFACLSEDQKEKLIDQILHED